MAGYLSHSPSCLFCQGSIVLKITVLISLFIYNEFPYPSQVLSNSLHSTFLFITPGLADGVDIYTATYLYILVHSLILTHLPLDVLRRCMLYVVDVGKNEQLGDLRHSPSSVFCLGSIV